MHEPKILMAALRSTPLGICAPVEAVPPPSDSKGLADDNARFIAYGFVFFVF